MVCFQVLGSPGMEYCLCNLSSDEYHYFRRASQAAGGKWRQSLYKHETFSQNPAKDLLNVVRGMRSNEDQVNVFSGEFGKSWAPVRQKRTPDGHRTQCTCYSGVRGWASNAQHVFTAAQLPNRPLTQSLFLLAGPRWHCSNHTPTGSPTRHTTL